jgi:hypothetical protein
VPKILPKLEDGTFLRAFTAKGRFADWLARIPVKVILDPKTALRGAAAYVARMRFSHDRGSRPLTWVRDTNPSKITALSATCVRQRS